MLSGICDGSERCASYITAQVFNTYGEYGNAKLLSCYAFAIPNNIFDCLRLPPLEHAAASVVGCRAARSCNRWIRAALRDADAAVDQDVSGASGRLLTPAARAALRRALGAAERGWTVKARYK